MDKLQKDANSEKVEKIIQKDIKVAVKHKQLGTPTMRINGKFNMGIPKGGYPELKKEIIKLGGKPKHLF
jgi:protein-disulfide isomerase